MPNNHYERNYKSLYNTHLNGVSKENIINHKQSLMEIDQSNFLGIDFKGCGKEPLLDDYKTNPATMHNAQGLWEWEHEDWTACKSGKQTERVETAEKAKTTYSDIKELGAIFGIGGDKQAPPTNGDYRYELGAEDEKAKKKKMLTYTLIGLALIITLVVIYIIRKRNK